MSYVNDMRRTQQISEETVKELRNLKDLKEDGPTTQKINKRLDAYEQKRLREAAEAEKKRRREEAEQEERILKQLAPVVQKQDEHDGVLTFVRRKLGIKQRKD